MNAGWRLTDAVRTAMIQKAATHVAATLGIPSAAMDLHVMVCWVYECMVRFISSCTLILQTSTNAVQTPPILASMPVSTPLDHILAVATMDMCLILMESLVEVSSALLAP